MYIGFCCNDIHYFLLGTMIGEDNVLDVINQFLNGNKI